MDEEELKQIKQALDDLAVKIDAKIGELSKAAGKTIGERKECIEENIRENSIAYMAGAFFGGVFVGYMMGKGKGDKV
jgi:hypothetical protein